MKPMTFKADQWSMTSTWIRLYGVAVLKAAHENSLAEDPRDARLLLCLYQHLVSSACHDQQFNNHWYNTIAELIWNRKVSYQCHQSKLISLYMLRISFQLFKTTRQLLNQHKQGAITASAPAAATATRITWAWPAATARVTSYTTATDPERKMARTEKEKQLEKIKVTCYQEKNKKNTEKRCGQYWSSSNFLITVLRLTPSKWKRVASSRR